ncbi:hypothetical protein [Halopiger xanaduensis]|uniref:Uncharacterized protein n=1 Tax=Halopiger xanaduensis (strain DSM 18323 / JCM 14033 / SH-6) TaxID=797210 RepID=F8D547_HALXS|nr:hypothetical protein [Halopiger xanaduensis]AEH36399.1 hypothetical protein Halxa_1771 [Halopiger xanaduensis SH-6]
MEPGAVPPYVDVVIYLYFATVATIGRYLHGRLWFGARSAAGRSDDGSVSGQNS